MKTKIYEIQINGEREWVCADLCVMWHYFLYYQQIKLQICQKH